MNKTLILSMTLLSAIFSLYGFEEKSKKNMAMANLNFNFYCPDLNKVTDIINNSMSQMFLDSILNNNNNLFDSKDSFLNYKIYSASEVFGEVRKGTLQTELTCKKTVSETGIEMRYFRMDGKLCALEKYSLNKLGDVTEKVVFDQSGSLLLRIIYKYDSDRNRIMQSYYTAQGALSKKIIFSYLNKRCNEIIRYNKDLVLEYKWIYKYDDQKNIIIEKKYNYSGLLVSEIQEIYESQNIILESTRLNEKKEQINRFKYKWNNSRLVENITSWNPIGSLVESITFKYDYNSSGIWITKTKYKSKSEEVIGQPVLIEEKNYSTHQLQQKSDMFNDDPYENPPKPNTDNINYNDGTGLFDVQVEAKFPGGDDQFREFISNNFEYPERCREEGIEGYVKLKFLVDVNGRISRITVLEETKLCPEFAKEAIRVLQKSPPWIPAQKDGRFVNAVRELPISIGLK